jgi:tetratricopeptide (TPR) repeat protein
VPTRETIATYIESLGYLLQNQNWNATRKTLEFAFTKAKILSHFMQLAQTLKKVPSPIRSAPEWQGLALQIACYGREPDLILEMQQHLPDNPETIAYIAWAYCKHQQYTKALNILEKTTELSGLAWRIQAECLAALQRPGWHEAFTEAKKLLVGRALGICQMEYGSWCFFSHQLNQAQNEYSQAYALLKHDPHYAAWIKYNLGLVTLELNLPEAEQHFYVVQDLSQHNEAKTFRSRAWSGIGAVRRSQGQWSRAIFAYQKGIELSLELDDRLAAYCGLAQTYRCAGELNQALETLYIALDLDMNTNRDKIHVLLAATHLQRQQHQEAHVYLQKLENLKPHGETGLRLQILNAEILRHQKKTKAAIVTLKKIPPERLCVREEQHCFPELFAIAALQWQPKTLPKNTNLTIQVRALGVLEVQVNQQRVRIKPTSKMAELLILLLEHGGHTSSEVLCEALYPKQKNFRLATQALWALSKQLREALGWENSLEPRGKAYALEQNNTNWDYDAAKTTNKTRLLEGIYSNWVQEIRQNTN